MDLNEYFFPLKRWWWLLAAAAVMAGITSFLVARMQPSIYQAHTTLMVGQTIENPNPNSGDFFLEQSLAGVYADMAYREPVRNATMNALGLSWLPNYISQPVPNSQLLMIQVTDSNPKRAMMVASELAHQLILRSPNIAQSGEEDRQSFLNQQLDSLQSQISTTQADIVNLQQELGGLTSVKQIADTQNQITALQAKLITLQANYANLMSSTQKGAVNSLTVVETAELPTSPINQSKMRIVLLATVIGLVLSAAGAYGIEFFDRTLKTESDINRVMKLPVLGYIAEMESKGDEWKYFMQHPYRPTAEAFRSLRGNIDFDGLDGSLKTIYVSSILASSGKTTIAANLALAFLSGGKRVMLVDADPFRPRIHEILDIPIDPGLIDVLTDQMGVHSVIRLVNEIPDLKVITAGKLTEGGTEPGFWKIDQVLSALKDQADIIIVDGPPLLVPDGSILASKVDGVLMVLQPGSIRQDIAKATVDQLIRSKARTIGVVFNRIARGEVDGYAGYSYYTHYASDGSSLRNSHKPHQAKSPIAVKILDRIKREFPSNDR